MNKPRYTAEHEQKVLTPINSKYIKAFASVFDETKYDVGGTFTFSNGNTIDEEHAKHFVRLFLNELDKTYFSNKAARKNIRVEREVFIHRTHEGGRFIHFHIWFRNLGNRLLFAETLQEVWRQSIYSAGEVKVRPLTSGSGFYGWREDISELGKNCWMTDLSHTDKGSREYLEVMQHGLPQATLDRLYRRHKKEEGSLDHINQECPMRERKQRQRDWVNRSSKQRHGLLH